MDSLMFLIGLAGGIFIGWSITLATLERKYNTTIEGLRHNNQRLMSESVFSDQLWIKYEKQIESLKKDQYIVVPADHVTPIIPNEKYPQGSFRVFVSQQGKEGA